MGFVPKYTIIPEVYLLSLGQLSWFASAKHWRRNWDEGFRTKPWHIIPWKYLKILFIACQCGSLEASMNKHVLLTTENKYDLVIVMYYNVPSMLFIQIRIVQIWLSIIWVEIGLDQSSLAFTSNSLM